jgi:hypothetical protein
MEDNVKWEEFVNEHDINVEELPDNVKHKIEIFEETFSDYEATDDEDETALRDFEAKLNALDNGILSDLQSFIEKKKESAPAEDANPKAEGATPKAEDGGQTPPEPPKHQASDKPSWAFWM